MNPESNEVAITHAPETIEGDVILSPNYNDRKGRYPWLVRRPGQARDEAIACRSVVAENVRFTRSSNVEKERGCSIVGLVEGCTIQGIRGKESIPEDVSRVGEVVTIQATIIKDTDRDGEVLVSINGDKMWIQETAIFGESPELASIRGLPELPVHTDGEKVKYKDGLLYVDGRIPYLESVKKVQFNADRTAYAVI